MERDWGGGGVESGRAERLGLVDSGTGGSTGGKHGVKKAKAVAFFF